MKRVYKYDSTGKYVGDVLLIDGEEIPKDCTDIPLPQPNWKPVFQNGEWVETATNEEKTPKNEPTQIELMQKAIDDLILGGF